jgi:GT2 family glycosyltransferase
MAETASSGKMEGLQGELDALSLDEACKYYHNYLNTFQIDLPLAITFINRLLTEKISALPDQARVLLEQAIKSAVELANLDPQVLGVGVNSGICPGAATIVKILEATHAEPAVFEEIRKAPIKFHAEDIRKICTGILARHPMAMRYADLLLQVDLFEGNPPSEILAGVHCPKVLRSLWNKRLFNHHAALGDDARAWPLWDGLKDVVNDPFTLSRAAEMYRRQGDIAQALALYGRAQERDPLQRPYALRLESLRTPFMPDHGLVDRKKVAIYLYSYNKATVLGETLESLSHCAIGGARLKILLNGCTDDSAAVAARARDLFPENEVEIIALPVNVGAPAARNWLLAQPATRESEYVAFLDDDIYLQPDWLAHLLTVAESDPRIGNVGCKIVFPGEFNLLQYLYRHVSIANEDAIRVSLPTPYLQYDIGLYDVIREARVVMGCQHLLRVDSLADAPWFDIRYSPSQIDDTDHDIQLCLAGWKVFYCGTVTCVHRQNSGTSARSKLSLASQGSVMGNDVKFLYKWYEQMDAVRALDSLGLNA